MTHNTRYDKGDDVIVDSKPLERHGEKGWVERISKPDSDSPTYHIRFPDQPDGTAPISFKAGDLKKATRKFKPRES